MFEYPENCIQYMAPEDWWQEDSGKTLCRGALVETYVQFYAKIPLELVAKRAKRNVMIVPILRLGRYMPKGIGQLQKSCRLQDFLIRTVRTATSSTARKSVRVWCSGRLSRRRFIQS